MSTLSDVLQIALKISWQTNGYSDTERQCSTNGIDNRWLVTNDN